MTKKNISEKTENRLGEMIKSFGKKYKAPFFASIVLLIVSVVLVILAPSRIQELANLLQKGAQAISDGTGTLDLRAIGSTGIILVVFYVGSFLSGTFTGTILKTAIQRYSRDLRESISKKINRIPLSYYNTRQTGDILSIITNDVDTLGTSLQNGVTLLFQSLLLLAGVVIAMFISCASMAVVVLLSLPVILIILVITIRIALPLFDKNQKYLGQVNTVVEENFSGQMVIKAFNAEKKKGKTFLYVPES